MNVPDLKALQRGESAAWDEAFAWLWPTVFAAAQAKLQAFLPGDIEDAAIVALEELVEKTAAVKSAEELKPLAAAIAHNLAVSRLRRHFSDKRGSGQTESLDDIGDKVNEWTESKNGDSPLDWLEKEELAERLRKALSALKPPMGEMLRDFYLGGMRYEEIAKKHGIAIGSVGVYLKRGLEVLRRLWRKDGNR
jgi:RNA polymerase sigma-70 factor (ECF subfamily)